MAALPLSTYHGRQRSQDRSKRHAASPQRPRRNASIERIPKRPFCALFAAAHVKPRRVSAFGRANPRHPMAPQTTMGDIVAECELSAGRPDAAEARCGQALEKVRGHARGTCHVEETLTSVCTAQGKDAEAIEHARA